MKLLGALLILFIKNILYYHILTRGIAKWLFAIIGFTVVVFFQFIGVHTLDYKDKGILPMILNLDFFLLVYFVFIKAFAKVGDRVNELLLNNRATNPLSFLGEFFGISLKQYYIGITIIEAFLVILLIKKIG